MNYKFRLIVHECRVYGGHVPVLHDQEEEERFVI